MLVTRKPVQERGIGEKWFFSSTRWPPLKGEIYLFLIYFYFIFLVSGSWKVLHQDNIPKERWWNVEDNYSWKTKKRAREKKVTSIEEIVKSK